MSVRCEGQDEYVLYPSGAPVPACASPAAALVGSGILHRGSADVSGYVPLCVACILGAWDDPDFIPGSADWLELRSLEAPFARLGSVACTPDEALCALGLERRVRYVCSGDCVGRYPRGVPHEPCTFTTSDPAAAFTHFERTCHAVDERDSLEPVTAAPEIALRGR